jgi:hypothetical protein
MGTFLRLSNLHMDFRDAGPTLMRQKVIDKPSSSRILHRLPFWE